MIQTLGQTTNFTVEYDDAIPNAIKRAQVLLNYIESDYVVMPSWFGVVGAFGPGNRVNIYVDLPDNGGGFNRGYHKSGKSEIHIDAQNQNLNDALAGDMAKMIFVAEFSELLMSYLETWDAGASTGEGLSRFCARERYETANDKYFPIQVGWWVNSNFENWIDATDNTDLNKVSYNCSLLFIYYLRYQLNLSIYKIIALAGPTLEQTYQNLTGQTGGYNPITNLLKKFFPNSLSIVNQPDIFPLLDPADRQLLISSTVQSRFFNHHIPYQSGSATESFLGCGPRNYSFDIFRTYPEIKITVKDIGFGLAWHRWYINDVILPTYYTTSVQVPATIYRRDLSDPLKTIPSTEMIQVDYTISEQLIQPSITLFIPGVVGQVELIIRVEAHDRNFMPEFINTAEKRILLATEKIVWEDQYYKDAVHCRDKFVNSFREIADPFSFLKQEIAIIFTLPDPAPDHFISLQQLDMQYAFLERARKHLPKKMILQVEQYIERQVSRMPHLAARLSTRKS